MSQAEAREAKLRALREMIEASIAGGGENSEDDVDRMLDAAEAELEKVGY